MMGGQRWGRGERRSRSLRRTDQRWGANDGGRGAAEPLLAENQPMMGGEANDGGAKGIINMLSKLFELSKTLKI